MKTTKLVEKIRESMTTAGLSADDKSRLLVALSGGADSVALLRALLELGYDCVAAHCNFHLRGDESMRDELFVRDLCQRLGVELHVQDFDVEAYKRLHRGVSTEMACRSLRYDWFYELTMALKCRPVAVAHHADDNLETFFLNLLRGTGINGLVGMRTYDRWARIVRPMLGVTRGQVLQYLHDIGQDYVTDSTNLQNDYRRNRLRNVVLPAIDREFDNARHRIADTMRHLDDERELLDYLVARIEEDDVGFYDEDTGDWCYCRQKLLEAPKPGMMLYALLRRSGFNRTQCDQAVKASVGATFHTSSHTLTVERKSFLVQRDTSSSDGQSSDGEIVVDFDRQWHLQGRLEAVAGREPFATTMVDGKRRVAFGPGIRRCTRVVLRHWRKGDRMRPFGMRGTKLISDLFVDLKFTAEQKKAVWLMEADGEIVWVLGARAAQAFVVEPGSTDYVLLTYS
ncbi:MAG: tRNA lysidine(34) synthetase TilS [Muribaculaceae bacterium]|nr:tRNA lysidine(34) synthetase TilS [Muribaculaceae bacterium]